MCDLAGISETVISNERLHAALTAPAFHLVATLAQQIAGGGDDASSGQPGAAGQRSSSGSVHMSRHRDSSMERAESASSATRVNVCVMEGVQEDAYRGYGPAMYPHRPLPVPITYLYYEIISIACCREISHAHI